MMLQLVCISKCFLKKSQKNKILKIDAFAHIYKLIVKKGELFMLEEIKKCIH